MLLMITAHWKRSRQKNRDRDLVLLEVRMPGKKKKQLTHKGMRILAALCAPSLRRPNRGQNTKTGTPRQASGASNSAFLSQTSDLLVSSTTILNKSKSLKSHWRSSDVVALCVRAPSLSSHWQRQSPSHRRSSSLSNNFTSQPNDDTKANETCEFMGCESGVVECPLHSGIHCLKKCGIAQGHASWKQNGVYWRT